LTFSREKSSPSQDGPATARRPLVSIITPVLNGRTYLDVAINSVINQTYQNVEYIVIDGGSTDGTVDIIRKYEDRISYWISEPDGGLYDALLKGFAVAKGDWIHWVNSDDFLMPWTVQAVIDHASITKSKWITGTPAWFDAGGNMLMMGWNKWAPKWLIRIGAYHNRGVGFLQQESIFFSSDLVELMTESEIEQFRSLKLAGDYWLWRCFAKHISLKCMPLVIGGFRVTDNNMSVRLAKHYEREVERLNPPRKWIRMIRPILFGVGVLLDIKEKIALWKINKSKIRKF